MHTIVNSRKYIDVCKCEHADQVFSIDMNAGTFTLYNKGEERGTMKIDCIYSNWETMFYEAELFEDLSIRLLKTQSAKPLYTIEEPTVLIEELDLTEFDVSEEHANTAKMKKALPEHEFDFWNYCINERKITDEISIEYSGCGDSGQTNSITCKSTSGLDDDVEFDVEVWKLISAREEGFYNNDGGYGTIRVSASNFEWTHHNYYTDSVCSIDENYSLTSELTEVKDEDDDVDFERSYFDEDRDDEEEEKEEELEDDQD